MKNEFNTRLYEVLYKKFFKQFVHCYLKTNHSEAAAEDTASDFLLKFCTDMSDGRDVIVSDAFIMTSFRNFIKDAFRKKKPVYFSQLENNNSNEDDMPIESKFDIAGADDADKRIFSADNKSILSACFAKMQAEDVNYLKLRFAEGKPNRVIATMLGQSADYVANRVNRAKTAFKKAFLNQGYKRGDF